MKLRETLCELLDSQHAQLDQVRADARAVHRLMLQRFLELLLCQELALEEVLGESRHAWCRSALYRTHTRRIGGAHAQVAHPHARLRGTHAQRAQTGPR